MPTSVKIERVGTDPVNWFDVITRAGFEYATAWGTLQSLLTISEVSYIGRFNGQVACVWGLVPPTLLSQTAHLWLIPTDLVKENQFLFVRHSQRVVERLLNRYPIIIGTTDVTDRRAIRWIKWLGGEYGSAQMNGMLNFVIRKK